MIRTLAAPVVVAVLALAPLTGCQATKNAADGAGAYLDKTAHDIQQGTDDAAITLAVKGAIFKADEKLSTKVHVGTSNGRVSLSGTVDTPSDKIRAEQIATGVKGVTGVLNALDVAGAPGAPPSAPPPPAH